MTKGSRKSGGKRKRVQQFNRALAARPRRTTILIVVEGEKTEQNYFRSLRSENKIRGKFMIRVKCPGGGTREAIMKKTVEYKKQGNQGEEYDEVWCILDVETQRHRKSLMRAIGIAERNGINVCLSNPCFEIWLRSHFVKSKKSFQNGDKACAELTKLTKKKFNCKYQKNDENIYSMLKKLQKKAISNSKSILSTHRKDKKTPSAPVYDCNSSTEVFNIIERLLR